MLEQVGTVFVDAGLVWVGDPCYIMGDDASSRVKDWDDFCDKMDDRKQAQAVLGKGVGLAIESGYGDGEYPVFIEKNRDGRVAKIVVEFEPDDTEDNDEDYWGIRYQDEDEEEED